MTEQHLGAAELFKAASGLLPGSTLNVIQTLGPSFSIGAFQGVDPADLIVLVARATAVGYMTFHQTLDSAGAGTAGTDYQVPAGRQLIIGAILFASAGAASVIVVGYGDDGVAQNNVAAPTAAVALIPQNVLVTGAANTTYSLTVALKVPASKFPYFYTPSVASTGCLAVGILRNA